MRILVCGGRDFIDWKRLNFTLLGLASLGDNVIIQGGAKGADFLAKVWAHTEGYECEEYPANWEKYGKSAGPIRNQQMLDEGKPDVVVAFPGGTGTNDMVWRAKKAGVKVLDYR